MRATVHLMSQQYHLFRHLSNAFMILLLLLLSLSFVRTKFDVHAEKKKNPSELTFVAHLFLSFCINK